MFNIVNMMLAVFVDILLVAGIICASRIEVKPLEIGTSGTIPCDHVENDPEVRLVQWYKSRRIDQFVNGDKSLAWWREGESRSLLNYQLENTTFSLIIEEATLEDEGLYKCSVVRGDLSIETNYFARTVMYALPRIDPEVVLNIGLNRVNCTVEHVKPMIYPVFNFDYSHAITETYAVVNEDGTYTTSICCRLPNDRSASPVYCSFSYLHYQREGSLVLPDTTNDSLLENKTTTLSPMGTSVTGAGDRCNTHDDTAIIVCGICIGLQGVAIFILLIIMLKPTTKCCWGLQNWKLTTECDAESKQPAMGMTAEVTT